MSAIEYGHQLSARADGMLVCCCRQFVGNEAEAVAHFTATIDAAVRQQTGLRGWWHRVRRLGWRA